MESGRPPGDTSLEAGFARDMMVHHDQAVTMAMMIRDKKRPPHCIFNWGTFTFAGVITSLTQKYTMFLADGTRVRCECAVKMMAASSAEAGKAGASSGAGH